MMLYCDDNNNMRSVSIVYKKPRPQPSLHQLPHPHSLAKRSVDEYYTRLAERERNKEELLREKEATAERVKLKTSNSQRQDDRLNILQTLSIVPMSLRKPPSLPEKDDPRKISTILPSTRPPEPYRPLLLRGLDLPTGNFEEQLLEERGLHSKLRVLLRCKESKETVVVLTANFVSNERYFWGEEEVEDQAVKSWRLLQSYASIAWICQKEDTLKKLSKFAKGNGLRLDAVYLVIPRKERTMSFSCQAIENDFGVRFQRSNTPLMGREERRMVALCGVEGGRGEEVSWKTMLGRMPVMRNRRSVVHFIRIDMTDHSRLNNAVRVLSQETLPRPLNKQKLLSEFQKDQRRTKVQQECGCRVKIQSQPMPLLPRIQEIKSSMTKFFTQSLSLSLTERFCYEESENSLQFLIGDALRRNFKIFQQAQTYSQQHAAFLAHRKAHAQTVPPSIQKANIQLTRPSRSIAYFWDL